MDKKTVGIMLDDDCGCRLCGARGNLPGFGRRRSWRKGVGGSGEEEAVARSKDEGSWDDGVISRTDDETTASSCDLGGDGDALSWFAGSERLTGVGGGGGMDVDVPPGRRRRRRLGEPDDVTLRTEPGEFGSSGDVDATSRRFHGPSKAFFSLFVVLLSSTVIFQSAEACSSRSTPTPRPPTPSATSIRPNITFQTYACPPAYAAWYCLNGATCFTVKIGESLLYNCECADGYMGQRCEYKDLDGTYLPTREKVTLETASIAGGATVAVILVAIVCVSCWIYLNREKKKKLKMGPSSAFRSDSERSEVDAGKPGMGFTEDFRPFSGYGPQRHKSMFSMRPTTFKFSMHPDDQPRKGSLDVPVPAGVHARMIDETNGRRSRTSGSASESGSFQSESFSAQPRA